MARAVLDPATRLRLRCGVYNLSEIRRLFEDFLELWDSIRWEVVEVLEAGDQVVMPMATHHRGRDGIEAQTRAAWVWTIRDGTILRTAFYREEPQEALEAAGYRSSAHR